MIEQLWEITNTGRENNDHSFIFDLHSPLPKIILTALSSKGINKKSFL